MDNRKGLQVIGYRMNSDELNLASMFKRTIEKAFESSPGAGMEEVAGKLGITTRSLYRITDIWDIERASVRKRRHKRMTQKTII